MSKQLTPIQKAIEWCHRGYRESKDIQMAARYLELRNKLKSLLSEEKQFAKKAYDEGFDNKECTIVAGVGEMFPSYTTDSSFDEYYKQYEDEKEI